MDNDAKRRARVTRRRNARLGIPGRTRRRVAEILSKQWGEYVDPTYVRPTTGWYRTSPHADVYRWEYSKSGDGRSGGCWWTMTQFIKEVAKHKGKFHQNRDREFEPGPAD